MAEIWPNAMSGRSVRSIVEEASFTASRKAIIDDAKRWDEFWRGAEWGLARDPAGFDQVDVNLWVIICEPSRIGMPRLRVYYAFDDANVYLKWVERG